MLKLDHAPYVREWTGLVKSLVQIMVHNKDYRAELPGLGIARYSRKHKTLSVKLEKLDSSVEELLDETEI